MLLKTLGVITPTTGAGPELFGVAYLSALAFGCPSCPSLAWGGCGGREFPRTSAAPHPVPTLSKLDGIEISVKVVRHISEKNLWKTEVRILLRFSTWSYGHGYGVPGVAGMPRMVVGGPGTPSGPGIPGMTVSGVPGVPGV
jgi:hypothetical protein